MSIFDKPEIHPDPVWTYTPTMGEEIEKLKAENERLRGWLKRVLDCLNLYSEALAEEMCAKMEKEGEVKP